jgi:arabinose-5-phosphate isomerase
MDHETGASRASAPAATPGGALLKAVRSALDRLEADLDCAPIEAWSERMLGLRGRVVLSGMGKSGLVAQKIAATFASTGCPSFFLHPAEAIHGDLGMVTREDSVLLLSNSGESEEILRLLPSLMRMEVPLAAITSRPGSTLGKAVRWCFTYSLPEGEGCPLELAPMASTTLQLIWGDLLAAHQMVKRGFTPEHFAQNHPGGSIGAKLLRTMDLMHSSWPRVQTDTGLVELLQVMSDGKLGMATVMRGPGMAGVVSDGDLRRALQHAQKAGGNPLDLRAGDIMTANPITLEGETWAVEAAGLMEARKITFLVVVEQGQPVGILHIHDLLKAKVL